MSNNDYILNLLNIKDPNIYILNKIYEKNIKGKTYKIVEGILTYNPTHCPCCGAMNESTNDIIKWGFRKNCKIKIPKISNMLSLLILHKQRFFCKNCKNTFIAETNVVGRNKNISNNTELQINIELMTKQSEKDIAKRLNVSVSKINRKLNNISSHTVLRHESLPTQMNRDEFKATGDTKGKMAFMIVNNKNGKIFDINDSRKSLDLEKYNKHFKKEVSQKDIVSYLINTDKTLKATYECYQGLINSIKDRDFNKFRNIVFHNNNDISSKMKKAIKLYKENIKYIKNSFKYDINNGVIEGKNNLVKCIKRIAFGYRKYDHFIARVFLISGIIKE